MRLVAFMTDTASVTRILQHIGEPTQAPALSPARGSPAGEETFDQTPVFDPTASAPALWSSTRALPGSAAIGPSLRPLRRSRRPLSSVRLLRVALAFPSQMSGGPFPYPRATFPPRLSPALDQSPGSGHPLVR
jgi:hypothetical protein